MPNIGLKQFTYGALKTEADDTIFAVLLGSEHKELTDKNQLR